MRVKSVELINYKSYKHTTVEFSKGINLLLGANNSGKSTIIESLINLQYPHLFTKKSIRSGEINAKTYINIIDIDDEDYGSFYNREYHQEYEESDKFTICWGLSNGDQPEEHLYFNSNLTVKRKQFNTVEILDEKGNKTDLKHFKRFSDKEDENNFIYPFLSKRKSDYYDSSINEKEAFRVYYSLRNLAPKIQMLDSSSHPRNKEYIKCCEDILGFRIGVIPAETNNGVEVGIYAHSTSMIPIRSMGEGVANILGLIAILLTENNKLFLIEELENDIHPKALKKLLKLIVEKSDNNQFIISTHSNIVLKYLGVVPNSKIFYIDWTPGYNEEDKVPTSIINEVENTPEKRLDILDKLGYDLLDFELFESYIILEESSAELIIRDFLIRDIVPGLYNRVKTIAAKGVSDLEARVHDFNRLFVFVHTSPAYYKKAWVLADGDEFGKECILKLKRDFTAWPEEHFINLNEMAFEKYYPERFQKEVTSVLSMPHGQKKQDAKTKLLKKVTDWALKNKDDAIKEFSKSAKEVIDILKRIEKELNKSK